MDANALDLHSPINFLQGIALEESIKDREIHVVAVHGARLPLGSTSAGLRAAEVAGATTPSRGLRPSN